MPVVLDSEEQIERKLYLGGNHQSERLETWDSNLKIFTEANAQKFGDTRYLLYVQLYSREANLYRAKGCFPITGPGECCPSSWDCSAWDNR
jgi:hypothetical protein